MKTNHILVVRFRQMGDAVLATPMLDTLRANYPDAQIDFVLNDRIAPLFEGHPAISRIITFTDEERHSKLTYLRKVWRTVHETRYDIIIDMRSTANTMLFAAFSPRTPFRIGLDKAYTRPFFNHRFPKRCLNGESMIDHNLSLLSPLQPAIRKRKLSLHITEQERQDFRRYMTEQGVDFQRPVMLTGVTAKLAGKTWPEDRMTETLRRFMEEWPQVQLIFNYAPGQEERNAQRIYEQLGQPANVIMNVEARSMRQLAAMSANCTCYFGNEGGARHIVQAMGKPSLVVCSPFASKSTWLPEDDEVLTRGIAASDYDEHADQLTREQQYALITTDRVWPQLQAFAHAVLEPHPEQQEKTSEV